MRRTSNKITRIYIRHYRDNDQRTLYVDWSNGARTECEAERAVSNEHMRALVSRAEHDGLKLEHETW